MSWRPNQWWCDQRSLAAFRIGLAICVVTGLPPLPSWLALVMGLFALSLAIGYRARLTVSICWVGMVLIHVTDTGSTDPLLMVLLFLGMFLPLSARYSVDAAMDLQHAPESVRDGMVLEGDDYQRPLPATALALKAVLVLLVAPVSVPKSLLITALIAMLPGWIWDRFGTVAGDYRRERLRIYFDEDCRFCRKICYLFRTFLMLGDASIYRAQTEPEVYAVMQANDSWVVYDHDDREYLRWHAVLLLLRRSPLFWPLGVLLTRVGMGRWGDPLYGLIAGSRGWLSHMTAGLIPYRRERVASGPGVWIILSVWMLATIATQLSNGLQVIPNELSGYLIYALGLE